MLRDDRPRLARTWGRSLRLFSPLRPALEPDLEDVAVQEPPAAAVPRPGALAISDVGPFALLGLALVLALAFRCWSLGAVGFAEDETDIMRAVESYAHHDFSANAEHPMLAKLAAFGSVEAAAAWNAAAVRLHAPTISPEAALRAPAALLGGLTTIVVFLVGTALFDRRVGGWAALFWALDVNATAINRLAKEDTMLVFFLLAAAWLYDRGRRSAMAADPRGARRWYAASGVGFGLMLASKYMPHYFGLHALYQHVTRKDSRGAGPRWRWFFLLMGVGFLAFDWALLLPGSWSRLVRYLHEGTVIHTGYYYARHVYVSAISATPWGLPFSFYVVFLATKLPIAILAAVGIGTFRMVRLPRARGWVFARVFIVLTLLPLSLLAAKYTRYLLPLLAILDLVAAGGVVWTLEQAARLRRPWRGVAIALVAAAFVGGPLYAQVSAWPFQGLYQNAIGARVAPPGWFFPDDEFYDAGVREAVASVASVASTGAVVMSDATGVVDQYLRLSGRSDMSSLSLSHDRLPRPPTEIWMVVQDAHIYFENQGVIEQVRRRLHPSFEIRAQGVVAAQVYRFQ